MFNRKLKREISEQILAGRSRQEVYLDLKERLAEFDVTKDKLTRLIRYRPTLHARVKYRNLHNILIGFILLLAFSSVALGFSLYMDNRIPAVFIFIFPLFEIVILIELLYFIGQAYMVIAFILGLQLLKNLDQLDFSPDGIWITVSVLIVTGIIISLASYLSIKMCSPMKEMIVEVDYNGQKKRVTEMRFEDPIPDSPEDIL